ncbi:PadR family transcriptional regulator [Methanomassiliicoccus luminyensis]|uniref:PadR family transcriptional regulator n=1 Tax=Methanomassiliicoccus luminyensis TaxID=1080712 RepID=UPI00035D803F|nr:PadR family transcriptional regulator [Methanomassiliicoccus luminyensis]
MMFGRGYSYNGNRISPMQMVILLLLRKRPMYGYEVLKELRDQFDPVWVPKTGSIYPAIKRLEEHGLVSSERLDGTDHYFISEAGRKWVEDEVTRSPRDIRMVIRYLAILDDAAAEIAPEESGSRMAGRFHEMFEEDDPDKARHVKRLKDARDRMAKHIENIDRELEELGSEGPQEGSP